MYYVGVDPSAQDKGHGVAVYRDNDLVDLKMLTTVKFVEYFCFESSIYCFIDAIFSIENVCANNFTYSRNGPNQRNIGMCQQAQKEIMHWLDYFNKPYFLFKPSKDNWHDDKKRFERITKWKGSSNDDTRSAAYFGHLVLKKPANNKRDSY